MKRISLQNWVKENKLDEKPMEQNKVIPIDKVTWLMFQRPKHFRLYKT